MRIISGKGGPASASAKPARGIGKATWQWQVGEVKYTKRPPLLFRLARSSGVASTSAMHPAAPFGKDCDPGQRNKPRLNVCSLGSSPFSSSFSFFCSHLQYFLPLLLGEDGGVDVLHLQRQHDPKVLFILALGLT